MKVVIKVYTSSFELTSTNDTTNFRATRFACYYTDVMVLHNTNDCSTIYTLYW